MKFKSVHTILTTKHAATKRIGYINNNEMTVKWGSKSVLNFKNKPVK